jgi:hypothetical protein
MATVAIDADSDLIDRLEGLYAESRHLLGETGGSQLR